MSFYRINRSDLVLSHPELCVSFNIDIVENEISPFIIYGDDYKSTFKRFNNIDELRSFCLPFFSGKRRYSFSTNEEPDSCFFSSTSNCSVFCVNLTPQEFIQNYLSKSWDYNNRLFSHYLFSRAITTHRSGDGFGPAFYYRAANYSEIKDHPDDPFAKEVSSIFDNLSSIDREELGALLSEAGVDLKSTDKCYGVDKTYLQNPMFGRF